MVTCFCYYVFDLTTGRTIRMGLTLEQAIAEAKRSNLGYALMT